MKKRKFLFVALIIASSVKNTIAQTDSGSAFNVVLTSYLNLKNALTKDNNDSAKIASKQLFDTIDKIQVEKLSTVQQKTWAQYSEKLHYDAEHIKSTTDIDHQREHFSKLSVNMYKMLKALNINTADLFYQFCSMANEGKGAYWISEESQLNNPYMGKRMPRCGVTKETLKGNR